MAKSIRCDLCLGTGILSASLVGKDSEKKVVVKQCSCKNEQNRKDNLEHITAVGYPVEMSK